MTLACRVIVIGHCTGRRLHMLRLPAVHQGTPISYTISVAGMSRDRPVQSQISRAISKMCVRARTPVGSVVCALTISLADNVIKSLRS